MRALILGPQGSGKGIQASILCQKYNIVHISTGDIFRYNIKENTELGKKAKDYVDNGQLVPDDLVIELVQDRVIKDDCQNGYLLDGFPRNSYQAISFDEFLKKIDSPLDVVINIDVDNAELVKRISGRRTCIDCKAVYNINEEYIEKCNACSGELVQREDDKKEEVIMQRLKIYHEQTKPLIDYYKEQGILISVDGLGSIEEVYERIIIALGSM